MFMSKERMQMRAGPWQSWGNIPILTPTEGEALGRTGWRGWGLGEGFLGEKMGQCPTACFLNQA